MEGVVSRTKSRSLQPLPWPLTYIIIPRHKVAGGYRNRGWCPSFRPSVLPSRFVSGAEHKNRERYLNQTWYIDRSSGELVPLDSLGFLKKIFFFFFLNKICHGGGYEYLMLVNSRFAFLNTIYISYETPFCLNLDVPERWEHKLHILIGRNGIKCRYLSKYCWTGGFWKYHPGGLCSTVFKYIIQLK